MPTKTLTEFRVWLLEQIDLLTDLCEPMPPRAGVPEGVADAAQQREGVLDCAAAKVAVLEDASDVDDEEEKPEWPGPELSVFEDAADIVREAGEIALRLGLPDLYRATRVHSPMLAIPVAKELLGRCLAACNELIAEAAPTASADFALVASVPPPDTDAADAESVPEMNGGRPKLRFTYERAYRQYQSAEEILGRCTDKEAYKLLKAEGGKDLPALDTWRRYLRMARQHYGDQKHHPRGGRTGRSIVTPDQIEYRREDDNDPD
jgi:hypothetical protein